MCRSKRRRFSSQPTKLISTSNIQNSKAANLIKIRVANNSGLAMADSGAQISAISAKFYYRNLKNKIPLEKAFLIVNGVSGTRLSVKGKINTTIEIGELSLQQSFYVIENFNHNIILGVDFFNGS